MIDKIKNTIFTAEGRLNRLRYFKYSMLWTIGFTIFTLVATLIIEFIILMATGSVSESSSLFLDVIFTVPAAVGGVMLQIRRCHDLDKSGWFVVLNFIPIVNIIFGLFLFLKKGTDGTNRYGYDPLLNE